MVTTAVAAVERVDSGMEVFANRDITDKSTVNRGNSAVNVFADRSGDV